MADPEGVPHCSGLRNGLSYIQGEHCHSDSSGPFLFLVLPKLPTALETANLLVDHIFRLHDIASNIVSDRGQQFTSKVWKTSAKALGASSACLPFITSPTARSKGLFRAWSPPFAALPLPIHLHGVIIFPSVEYTHDIFTCSATRLSPFKASLGYQPPLFSSHGLSDCSSAHAGRLGELQSPGVHP